MAYATVLQKDPSHSNDFNLPVVKDKEKTHKKIVTYMRKQKMQIQIQIVVGRVIFRILNKEHSTGTDQSPAIQPVRSYQCVPGYNPW